MLGYSWYANNFGGGLGVLDTEIVQEFKRPVCAVYFQVRFVRFMEESYPTLDAALERVRSTVLPNAFVFSVFVPYNSCVWNRNWPEPRLDVVRLRGQVGLSSNQPAPELYQELESWLLREAMEVDEHGNRRRVRLDEFAQLLEAAGVVDLGVNYAM